MRTPHRVIICSTVIISVVISLFAAKFWEKKSNYTAWTKDECLQLIDDSPWCPIFTHVYNRNPGSLPGVAGDTTDPGWTRGGGETLAGEREVISVLFFRLLTAAPVRMAYVQLQLLENPTDEATKKRATEYLTAGKPDQIVFQITYSTRPAGASIFRDWDTFFRQSSLPDFQSTTNLTGSALGNVRLSEYRRPSPNDPKPAFIFPRVNDKGEAYFTGAEKSISLRSEFAVTMKGKPEKVQIYVKLDPKKMMFNNQFEF